MIICSAWLRNASEDQIKNAMSELGKELGRRYHAELIAKNLCIVCRGCVDIGSEQDHEPCPRCRGTGKHKL